MSALISEPKNQRSVHTRAAILEAAWKLLETVGPERTTMSAVAQEAKISRRGLYLHFPDRTELLIGLRQYIDQRYDLTESTSRVWTSPDGATALAEWARHLTEYHSRIRSLVEAVDHARRSDPAAAGLWNEATTRWRNACTALAEQLEASGDLDSSLTVPIAVDVLYSYMPAFNALWEALVIDCGWTPDHFQVFLATTLSRLLLPTR